MMITNAATKMWAAALPILMAAACTSEVDVPVDLAYPNVRTADASLTELDWSFTDSGQHFSSIEDLAWAPDGDLVALTRRVPPHDQDSEILPTLARFAPDGRLRWAVEVPPATIVPDPQYQVAAYVGAVDVFGDGRIVVGATVADLARVGDGGVVVASVQGALLWYGADGTLLASRIFPVTETGQGITWIESVLALPDGGTVFSGSRSSGLVPGTGSEVTTGGIVGRLDAGGETVWTVPIDNSSGDPSEGGGRREDIRHLRLMADGGIVFTGGFNGRIEIQDKSVSGWSGGYVARLEPDGSAAWLTAPLGCCGFPLVVAPSGNLIVMVRHQGRSGWTNLSEDERYAAFAVLDPGGALLGETDIEELPPIVSDRSSGARYAMAMAGESLVIGGLTSEPADPSYSTDYQAPFAALHDQSGAVIASRQMMVLPPDSQDSGVVDAIAVAPDGRTAMSGHYSGSADFGAGPVASDPDFWQAFIAVYAAEPPDVDRVIDSP